MTSMIEDLIGGAVSRPDDKRILPVKRPLPQRPRDLLEIFMALGPQATMESVALSCDLRDADPRLMTYLALSRWPTREELAEHGTPYQPRQHLRKLLMGQEFRGNLVRRLCDAFAERQRLLYVQIPRCASSHFLTMAGTLHAVLPPDLADWRPRDLSSFIPALGAYLGRFNFTKTTLIAQPRLEPFVQADQVVPPASADRASLPWCLNPPPHRLGDRLFTIIREPASLILSQVNAILTQLRADPADRSQALAQWRQLLPSKLPPSEDLPAWKRCGVQLLLAFTSQNPICSALADGTAAAAIKACHLADLEIVDLSRYNDWVKYKWNLEPDEPVNQSSPILAEGDLDAECRQHLGRLIDQDRRFHACIVAELAKRDRFNPSVRGRDLAITEGSLL